MMQYSAKSNHDCINCGEIIWRSEKRIVDGGMHKHFDCGVKAAVNTSDNDELTRLVDEWVSE